MAHHPVIFFVSYVRDQEHQEHKEQDAADVWKKISEFRLETQGRESADYRHLQPELKARLCTLGAQGQTRPEDFIRAIASQALGCCDRIFSVRGLRVAELANLIFESGMLNCTYLVHCVRLGGTVLSPKQLVRSNFDDLDNPLNRCLARSFDFVSDLVSFKKWVVQLHQRTEAETDILGRLPSRAFDPNRNGTCPLAPCTLCMHEFGPSDWICTLPCNHSFDNNMLSEGRGATAGCSIKPWIREHRTCPVCRYELKPHDQ